MVLDTNNQTLFIFGGQREERYLADMYTFHIPTRTVTELFSNFAAVGGPDPCFTHRAVIDCETREIYVYVAPIPVRCFKTKITALITKFRRTLARQTRIVAHPRSGLALLDLPLHPP